MSISLIEVLLNIRPPLAEDRGHLEAGYNLLERVIQLEGR